MDESEQVKRTREIEEVTNLYFIHPVSRTLVTYFARWGVQPNAVSVLGMMLGAAAAVAYYAYDYWPMAVLGFLLMIGWHVMDGADGQLARLTGQTSEIGKVLDGLCDYGTFVLVYLSLAAASAQALGPWVWIVAVLAGLSHAAHAGAYEFERQSYDFWVHGKASARPIPPDVLRRELPDREGVARLFGYLHLAYLHVQYRVAGVDWSLINELEGALCEGDDQAQVREAYRAVQRPAVRRWALLCSNYHTLAIFIACLAGSPLAYFLFEIVVLNAIFAGLRYMQAQRNKTLRLMLATSKHSSYSALSSVE
ncbi:MAG: CDP-alcohol phosphatidyltransferase family protein [Rhodothermales bacterium]